MKNFSLEFSDAIKNGKWLDITYVNAKSEFTRFYIAILDYDIDRKTLKCKMFNLSKGRDVKTGNNGSTDGITISISKIKSVAVLQHISYNPTNILVEKLEKNLLLNNWMNSTKGEKRIFNYYIQCLRYDVSPYVKKTFYLEKIDKDIFAKSLSFTPEINEFYKMLGKLTSFDKKVDPQIDEQVSYAFNVLSISTPNGVFPILYKKFTMDITNRTINISEQVYVNNSIIINNRPYHVSRYLEIKEIDLLAMYKKNKKKLIKLLTVSKRINKDLIDTKPVLYALVRNQLVNIDEDLKNIRDQEDRHHPLNAFLGKLTNRNKGRKDFPIMLVDKKVNIDQLRVITNSLKNPVTYVQGPPGTGKTSTILNVMLSYFINGKNALLTSYNNKPVSDVYDKLSNFKFKGRVIPFPVLRLGNIEKVTESLISIRKMYDKYKNVKVFQGTLDRSKLDQLTSLKEFFSLLNNYEEIIELKLKRDDLNDALKQVNSLSSSNISININLQTEISNIELKLKEIGKIKDEKALEILDIDFEEFYKWMYYTSCSHISRLGDKENSDLYSIITTDFEDKNTGAREFNKYISNDSNLRKLLKIFPMIISTNLSVTKLGSPKPHFDISIIDESGQCNIPSSLLTISRGEKLLMVGDVRQLKPVISLDPLINRKLMNNYKIREEYDYLKNSILSTMRDMDKVSMKVLLRYHYRCAKEIINYSNKKYYSDKLIIKTKLEKDLVLKFEDVESSSFQDKNTALEEVERIEEILKANPGKEYGIITPFRFQSELLASKLSKKFPKVDIGTIHKFQGGERDGIIISSGITKSTHQKTYDWLKGNDNLINVAITRAKSELRVLGDFKRIKKLSNADDDYFNLIEYVKSKGNTKKIKLKKDDSNVDNYFKYFENQFNKTLDIVITNFEKISFKSKVRISTVLKSCKTNEFDYFTRAEFDFVIYSGEKVLAVFEVDGQEHESDESTIKRDQKKNEICKRDSIELFRIKNRNVNRYDILKDIVKRISI